jgi:hypothetical protein
MRPILLQEIGHREAFCSPATGSQRAVTYTEILAAMQPRDWPVLIKPAFARTGHRPWPIPGGRPVLFQRWVNLAFLHWRIPADRLRPLVPAGLSIQEFDGASWVGIVPFDVQDLCAPLSTWLPLNFTELNVRLYVEADGKPGVWFVSLDASSWLAVAGARTSLRLPYFGARMQLDAAAPGVDFQSRRRRVPAIEFSARYRPAGDEFEPVPGTLDHFLIERYCLYTRWHDGRILRLDIQHPPWRVSPATVEIRSNTVAAMQGIGLDPADAPIAHFSRRQDTVAWRPTRIGRG